MTIDALSTAPRDETNRLVDAVLFDLHNTTLAGDYTDVGVAHIAEMVAERWGADPASVPPAFGRGIKEAMQRYIDVDYYPMRDMFVDALRIVGRDVGADPSDDELSELEIAFWTAGIPAARPVDGAIETFDALRAVGIKVGVVSIADEWAFDGLMDRLGFAEHLDVAVCSETAESCKPHAGIFHHALDVLGVPATQAMFVGDTIDSDIVGGNRLGMVTVHIPGGEHNADIDAFGDDPDTVPDHRVASLRDVIDLVV